MTEVDSLSFEYYLLPLRQTLGQMLVSAAETVLHLLLVAVHLFLLASLLLLVRHLLLLAWHLLLLFVGL